MLWIIVLVLFVASLIYQIPNIYAIMGNKAYHKKDIDKALKYYEKSYKIKRSQLQVKINYGILVLRDGRPLDAEKIFTEILENPKLLKSQKNLLKQYRCMAYLKQDKSAQALLEAQELLGDGENSELYGIVGYAMMLEKKPTEEIFELCEKAYEYNEDNRDIADNYAVALSMMGRYEEAVEVCDKVIKRNRFFPESRYHKALALLELGKTKDAIEEMDLLEECEFSYLTTVTDEEIDALREKLGMEAIDNA